MDDLKSLIEKIDAYSDWSMEKDKNSIQVVVDRKNCFVCSGINDALLTLAKAVEARNSGAQAAIHSLLLSTRSEQSEKFSA